MRDLTSYLTLKILRILTSKLKRKIKVRSEVRSCHHSATGEVALIAICSISKNICIYYVKSCFQSLDLLNIGHYNSGIFCFVFRTQCCDQVHDYQMRSAHLYTAVSLRIKISCYLHKLVHFMNPSLLNVSTSTIYYFVILQSLQMHNK